jgi:hypothetical protein
MVARALLSKELRRVVRLTVTFAKDRKKVFDETKRRNTCALSLYFTK